MNDRTRSTHRKTTAYTAVGHGVAQNYEYQFLWHPLGFRYYAWVPTTVYSIGAQVLFDAWPGKYSYIKDTQQSRKEWGKSRAPKAVYHVKALPRTIDFGRVDTLKGPDGAKFTVKFDPISPIMENIITREQSIGVVPVSVTLVRPTNKAFLADAMQKMLIKFYTQIPEQTSLANFLLEAKELDSLLDFGKRWTSLVGFVNAEHEVLRRLARARRNDRHSYSVLEQGEIAELARVKKRYGSPKTLGDILRFGRNGLLEHSFAWKPLLSDLQAFFELFVKVDKQIEYLRRWNKRTRHIRWQKTYQLKKEDYGISTMSNSGTTSGLTAWARVNPEQSSIVVHGSAMLYQDIEGLDSVVGAWRAIMSSYGLANPLKVGWNAIPYSFVVEYYTKLAGFLDLLAVRPFNGKWEVANVSHSIEERTSVDVLCQYAPPGDPSLFSGELFVTNFAVRHYTRSPGYPDGFLAFLQGLSPSSEQKLLVSALLDQKIRK